MMLAWMLLLMMRATIYFWCSYLKLEKIIWFWKEDMNYLRPSVHLEAKQPETKEVKSKGEGTNASFLRS